MNLSAILVHDMRDVFGVYAMWHACDVCMCVCVNVYTWVCCSVCTMSDVRYTCVVCVFMCIHVCTRMCVPVYV